MMTERERIEGRLQAAKLNGGAAAAQPRGSGRYLVTGRDGHTRYTVQVAGPDRAFCDCPAGIHRNADGFPGCWHTVAALMRDLADGGSMIERATMSVAV
jgi:hypothetical protein